MVTKEELAVIINEVLDDNPGLGSDELAERISQRAGLGLGYNNKFIDKIRAYKNSRSGLELVCESALELSGAKTTALSGDAKVEEYKIPIELLYSERPQLKFDMISNSRASDLMRGQTATKVHAELVKKKILDGNMLYFKWSAPGEHAKRLSVLSGLTIEGIGNHMKSYIEKLKMPYAWAQVGTIYRYRVIPSKAVAYGYDDSKGLVSLGPDDLLENEVRGHTRFLLCQLVNRARNELGIELSIAFNP